MKHFVFILLVILTACSSKNGIKVATAANTHDVMKVIGESFEKKHQIKIDLIVGSTGKLTTQIELGAPYDIFIAANTESPEYLYSKRITPHAPKLFAIGSIVLWTKKFKNLKLEDLTQPIIKKIAIANPKHAPYGRAGVEALKNAGIYKDIVPKLVFGENISQVNQFIESETVEVGITALSTVKNNLIDSSGYWTLIEDSLYQPIKQSVVLINEKSNNVNLFYNYLFSAESLNILKAYGYKLPNE